MVSWLKLSKIMKKLVTFIIIYFLNSSIGLASGCLDDVSFEIGGTIAKLKTRLLDQDDDELAYSWQVKGKDILQKKQELNAMIEAECSYQIINKVRLGFALRHYFEANDYYLEQDKLKSDTDLKNIILTEIGETHLSQNISSGFLNGYYEVAQSNKFGIFLHTGLGLSYIRFNTSAIPTETDETGELAPEVRREAAYLALGVKGGLGISHALASNIKVQIKYEYSLLDEFFLKEIKGDLVGLKLEVSSHNFIAGIRVEL